ncbi:MAG: hypothetical protein FWC00_02550 [Firmicutes bacterium]|nr:hypothetical protein [Bacillota bacterium]
MKKTILILLLIIPVVVVMLAYMLSGFIGRNITVVPISGIEVNYHVAEDRGILPLVLDEHIFQISRMNVGGTIALPDFVEARPRGARVGDLYVSAVLLGCSEPIEGMISVSNGVITVNKSSSHAAINNNIIELRIGDGVSIFMTIWLMEVV